MPGRSILPRAFILSAIIALLCAAPSAIAQNTRSKPAPKPRMPPASVPLDESPGTGPRAQPQAAQQAREERAPATPAPVPAFEPATEQELRAGYPLGVGDVVRVVVFQQPDMTTETRVSEAGTISVPLLGPVPVGNVTAKRAEERVGALLKARGLVRDPQVVVTVLQFKSRQVSVLGLVNRPGRYALEEGLYRLTDVLALAGGPLPEGADTVTLIRLRNGQSQRQELDIPTLFRSGDLSMNPEVLPGDSIYVARAPVFYIYGEVNKPGAFRLDKGMTVMQALSLSGGLTARGTEKNVQIRRRDASGRYVTQTSSLADQVQADDVVFVRESLF
jgi:polysaccharide export outer membrane protein